MSRLPRIRRRTVVVLLGTGLVVAAVGAAVFQPWKLVVDDVVDEAAPAALAELDALPSVTGPAPSGTGPSGTGPSGTKPSGTKPSGTKPSGTKPPGTKPPGTGPAAPGPAASGTGAGRPAAAPAVRVLASAEFVSHEHRTTGRARVVALPDGRRVLRIEDLDTSNGPDLRVWLSDAPVLAGRAGWHVFDDGRYVELGRLKGNRGSQNYTVPASVDLARLGSLTIWCDRFDVSFGAADLRA